MYDAVPEAQWKNQRDYAGADWVVDCNYFGLGDARVGGSGRGKFPCWIC
jgi:hypothetical protein